MLRADLHVPPPELVPQDGKAVSAESGPGQPLSMILIGLTSFPNIAKTSCHEKEINYVRYRSTIYQKTNVACARHLYIVR
ncbi:hypothetical protein WISP_126499 [Willisornis vidua]|uniref:Uncharacterized protein n=1 Tax=Willisornis vidua TaxID=1566151 RepID=A0ABQ9CQZ2_9PASS|nr:hypothetical protein WISP_126499 [Willisornis vidua]